MTRLFTFYFLCIIFGSACGQNKPENLVAKNKTSKKSFLNFDTSKIAIFNVETDLWLSEKFDNAKPFSFSNTDLKNIDEIFSKCVNQNNINPSYFYYKRQYVPFIDKSGQKKVWINCFCSDFYNNCPDWKKSLVFVDDGGSCFFKFIINLTDKSFSNFEVNGLG